MLYLEKIGRNKRRNHGEDWTTKDNKSHTRRKKAWSRDTDGPPAHHNKIRYWNWEVPVFRRGPGRPRTNCRDAVKKDLQRLPATEWSRRACVCVNTME